MLAPTPKVAEGGAEAPPRGPNAEARGALSPLHQNPLMTPARDRAGIASPSHPGPNLSTARMRLLMEQHRRAFSSGGGRQNGLHLELDDHPNPLRGAKRARLDSRARKESQPTVAHA